MQKYFKKSILTLVEERKIENIANKFLTIKLTKKGKEYPNYISSDDSVNKKKVEEEPKTKEAIPYQLAGNCEIDIFQKFIINLCNETVAEMLLVLPHIATWQTKNLNIAGNIISDIKKSSLDIYENFRSLKAKWKAMQYLK
jgi:hypothetical protein